MFYPSMQNVYTSGYICGSTFVVVLYYENTKLFENRHTFILGLPVPDAQFQKRLHTVDVP